MSYRVKTVALMTGISRPTLLAWERRYSLLAPHRSDNGYRIYSDADVQLLRRLKALVDAGHPISEAVTLAKTREVSEPPQPLDGSLLKRVIDALVRYDRAAVDWVGPELAQLSFAGAIELYLRILQHAGDQWERGQLTVAQEHFISAWVREQMMAIFHALSAGPRDGSRVVCVTAPGELHELGLLAVAVKLALSGWHVTWLGADLPIPELVEAVRASSPKLVCVSVMRHQPRELVLDQARQLRDALPSQIWVAIGGPGVVGLEAESTQNLLYCPAFSSLQVRLAALGMLA